MALRAVVDDLQPLKRWAGANETPLGPGSTAAPPLKGTVGGGGPPVSPNAPRTSQEATRGRRSHPPPRLKSFWVRCQATFHLEFAVRVPGQGPRAIPSDAFPPPEALKQRRAACQLKISVCLWDQAARGISFNRRSPPQRLCISCGRLATT